MHPAAAFAAAADWPDWLTQMQSPVTSLPFVVSLQAARRVPCRHRRILDKSYLISQVCVPAYYEWTTSHTASSSASCAGCHGLPVDADHRAAVAGAPGRGLMPPVRAAISIRAPYKTRILLKARTSSFTGRSSTESLQPAPLSR